MQSQGMRWHLMQEIWERGMQSVIEDAVAEALDGAEYLYVSVDIDVLDPAFAPGTGTPEPGGMSPVDLLRTVRRLAMEANLVALDVVEVSPPYDVSDNTVNNAHRVVLEALAGMAWRKLQAAGGQPGLPSALKGRAEDRS
jgi:agmatinase